jgi:hypothetical protein
MLNNVQTVFNFFLICAHNLLKNALKYFLLVESIEISEINKAVKLHTHNFANIQ